MSWAILLLLAAVTLHAQHGTPNRPKPADYPVHASLPAVEIAAEYMVFSFAGKKGVYVATDHLVVEVGLFPVNKKELLVSGGHFTLRMNGKKQVLFAQPSQFVAAALKYDNWERERGVIAYGGVGDTGVILGRPRHDPRFPGDNRERRLPSPPRAPDTQTEQENAPPEELAEEVVVNAALPEGPTTGPISGYLYFPYKGKTKSIKSLELIYNGPAGTTTLKLF